MSETMEEAMRRWVREIENRSYPAAEHVYRMKRQPTGSRLSS